MESKNTIIESEKALEKKLNKLVEAILKGWSLKLLPFNIAGLPDRLVLLPGGIVFFAEIKTTGRPLRPIQKIVINKIRKLGFNVYEIDNSKTLNEIIKKYAERE